MSGEEIYQDPKTHQKDDELYRQLMEKAEKRELLQEFFIPKESGRAFVVEKGQILRIADFEGPQVADFNAFSKENPREMFWSGRTRIFLGSHLTIGGQLWSTPPNMRPMFTIISDTVDHQPLAHGAASHDLLFSRCNERYFEMLTGERGRPNCQDNLAQAIADFDLTPDYVHDAFNIFMTTGVDDQGRLFFLEPDAKKGDYVELYAEIDSIVAVSACPGGCSGPQNKSLEIQIYRPSD